MSAPTKDLALAEARRLQAIMRDRGVECVIDLMPDSGGRWLEPMANRVAEMSHHIYSKRAHGLTRFYGFVRAGDPSRDLPGPLANGYGGWDEVYRIITLGRANHPGRGGPLTVAGRTIPRDNARPYTWGTEFEGGMDAADWTPSYRAFMARANAAILEWLALPVEAHVEHSTWAPGRKSDRLGYTAAIGRLEIARASTTSRPSPAPIAPPAPAPAPIPTTTPATPALLEEDSMPIFLRTVEEGATWLLTPGRDPQWLTPQMWELWKRAGAADSFDPINRLELVLMSAQIQPTGIDLDALTQRVAKAAAEAAIALKG